MPAASAGPPPVSPNTKLQHQLADTINTQLEKVVSVFAKNHAKREKAEKKRQKEKESQKKSQS